jgi:hypothetical protein
MTLNFYPKQHFRKAGATVTVAGTQFLAGRGTLLDHPEIRDVEEELKYHEQILALGFSYDEANNFYYREDGALVDFTGADSLEEYVGCSYNAKKATEDYGLQYSRQMLPEGTKGLRKAMILCTNYKEVLGKVVGAAGKNK